MRTRLLVLPFLLAACGATPEKIETWKGTQRGPDKLRGVVQDDGAAPQLRGLAAAALVEIGMGSEAATDLATASPAQKPAVVHELVAPLATLLGASATSAGPTTQVQRAAKDALFVARADAAPADRTRIDDLLVQWTTADLAARSSLGGQSSEKILAAIGAPAADKLVPLVTPGPDMVLAAKLIGELGNTAAQQKAADKIIAAAKQAGANVPDVQLESLGLLGGDAATQFLLDVAHQGNPATRKAALRAMALGPVGASNRRALDGALALAADAHADGGVREASFLVLEKIGAPSVDGLTKLFHDPNTVVRWRAVQASLKAGGVPAVGKVLAALPEDKPVTDDDLDSYVVHDLSLLGKEAVPALVAGTKVKPVLGQVAAIRALALVGKATDAGALAPLLADSTSCSTMKPPVRLSDEAAKAKTKLAGRN